MRAPWALDKTLRSRFECKYLISEQVAQEIERFTAAYLELDFFSARQADHRYPVHSLYLDGPAHELYQTTVQGMKNRFKLRIRGYDGNPDSPLFAEVKRRADRVIMKRRCLITRETARAMLVGAELPKDADTQNMDFVEFRSLSAQLGAKPTVYVSYLREAYEAMGSEPVRLTFDRKLQNAPVGGPAPFAFEEKSWAPTPCDQVILEIKYTDACPHWLELLAETFQLDRCSVAKYILCLDSNQERFGMVPSFHG